MSLNKDTCPSTLAPVRSNASISEIEKEYAANPSLRNGFANIANILLDNGQYEEALELFGRDHLLNRLSPAYRHIYAYALSKSGRRDEALLELTRALDEDPSLMYGFSLVDLSSGEACFYPERINENPVQKEKGMSEKRNTQAYIRYLALVNKRLESECAIAEAYQQMEDLEDGYAFLGSIEKAFCRYEKALYYYEKDRRLNRITPESRLILANLLARFERVNEAEEEVLKSYSENQIAIDGFALIGSVFRNNGRFKEALPFYERDRKLNRLSPKNRHIFADQLARSGRLQEAEDEISIGYTENSYLRNGYARIGNILRAKSEFKEALNYYERDFRQERISATHRIIYAELLARIGKIKAALNEVEIAYGEYPNIKDGIARCAWVFYWEKKEYDKLIELLTIDQNKGRLSPGWGLNLAKAYAGAGNITSAKNLIAKFYKRDSTLTNGYFQCAWQYYWPRAEYQKVVEFGEMDMKRERLTPACKLKMALAYAADGNIQNALENVSQAYAKSDDLKDGYARCAWHFYWPRQAYAKLIGLFERDNKKNRLSPRWKLFLAQAYAISGNINKAKRIVEEAYKLDPDLKNGYARCAWYYYFHYLNGEKSEEMTELMEMDSRKEKMSSSWKLKLARGYSDCGQYKKSDILVDEAYRENPGLKDGHASMAFSRYSINAPERNFELFKKDLSCGRLSDDFKKKFDSISSLYGFVSKISYCLPAVLVSLPRSGSNFIQNVIQDSSGFLCKSIYEPGLMKKVALVLKTHSISINYFENEWKSLFKSDPLPEKFIVIVRDPRDTAISFYEYVKFRKDTNISQSGFLKNIDYFYSSFIEKRIYPNGLSVGSAYREFVKNWWSSVTQGLDILKIRYEDIVGNPIENFQRIFNFLELDCKIDLAALEKKVSLITPSKRKRGLVYGWKMLIDEYKEIIEKSQGYFEKEISILGYNDMSSESNLK